MKAYYRLAIMEQPFRKKKKKKVLDLHNELKCLKKN